MVLFLLGFLIAVFEIILKLNNKTICNTKGCALVDSFTKSELLMLVFGAGLFLLLFILSILKKEKIFSVSIQHVISFIVILALTIEGYLVGFQLFVIKEYCLFCLTVAGLIFISAIYYLFVKKIKLVSLAFVSFLVVLFFTWFVNPAITVLPKNKYVLIYSEDCSHCHKVIDFCKERGIDIVKVEVNQVKGALRCFGINSVPALVCDFDNEKNIVVGYESIIQKLNSFLADSVHAEDTKEEYSNNNKIKPEYQQDRKKELELPVSGFCPIEMVDKEKKNCGN